MVLTHSISASNRVFGFQRAGLSHRSIIGNKSDLREDVRLVISLSIHLMFGKCEIANELKLSLSRYVRNRSLLTKLNKAG